MVRRGMVMTVSATDKVFNILHDMDTEEIKRVEDECYNRMGSLDPLMVAAGKRLLKQCRYVVELRRGNNDR